MAMTVVTAYNQNTGNPMEGFYHPDANVAHVTDGHLVLLTHAAGIQVAIYPPKIWLHVFEGETVERRSGTNTLLKDAS